jgi:glutathione S-transferase
MSLVFHGHPLSSYCWKVLIALYENGTPFEQKLVDLGDAEGRAAFAALWPVAKMPVLEDPERGEVVAETTIIIDYLDCHYPGPVRLIPEDAERARTVRFWDRVYDLYVQGPMQRIVGDRLRLAGQKDPFGVGEARALLATALGMIEREQGDRIWAAGDDFTLADCAAMPALHYADKVAPFGDAYPSALALLERLRARPSVARVLAEAAPYAHFFPTE